MRDCFFLIFLFFLVGCEKKSEYNLDDLNGEKSNFINKIFGEEIDESPFSLSYSIRTVFFSKDIVSLFGEFSRYTNLPHENKRYEGKTFIRIEGKFREIFFDDLFANAAQKESIRKYCEDSLRNHGVGYFGEDPPLRKNLNLEDIRTFVIDHRGLVIIFQRYVVAGLDDIPTTLCIPYNVLITHSNPNNPLLPILDETIASKLFISSWDEWTVKVQ